MSSPKTAVQSSLKQTKTKQNSLCKIIPVQQSCVDGVLLLSSVFLRFLICTMEVMNDPQPWGLARIACHHACSVPCTFPRETNPQVMSMISIKRAVNSFALASLPSLSDPWLVTHVLSMPLLSSGPEPRLCLLSFSLTRAVYTHPVRLQGYGAAAGCSLQVPRHRADPPALPWASQRA